MESSHLGPQHPDNGAFLLIICVVIFVVIPTLLIVGYFWLASRS